MRNIFIPKEKVLELIKKDTCKFYERSLCSDITVFVFDDYTEFCEFNYILHLSFKDLATLLFDRVIVTDSLTITVS